VIGVSTISVDLRKFETSIANSTQGHNPGIGIDPSDANSWPLRSPGILSRGALCGFLPLRRQLLDQPSRQMRNPSHQLNEDAGANDVPPRPPARDRGIFRFNCAGDSIVSLWLVSRDCARKLPAPLTKAVAMKCEVYCGMAF